VEGEEDRSKLARAHKIKVSVTTSENLESDADFNNFLGKFKKSVPSNR
jgi:hypothetical protein